MTMLPQLERAEQRIRELESKAAGDGHKLAQLQHAVDSQQVRAALHPIRNSHPAECC